MKYDLKVAEALEGVNDAIIEIKKAFGWKDPVTYAYYSDGSVDKYNIVGTLAQNVIPKTKTVPDGTRDIVDLVGVDIGNAVTSIGPSAFYEYSGMTSVTIPDSVTNIGNRAFFRCSGTPSITIPDNVTNIGLSAFAYCSGLTSITIPDSVTSISAGAFRDCTGLTSIIVDSNNLDYNSQNNCNAIIKTSDNTLIAGCKMTTIPNSVTKIGSCAFSGCSGLTSVTIPDSVTIISSMAFYKCSGLSSITIPDSVTIISTGTFSNCSELTSITIGNGVTSIGNQAFEKCSALSSIISRRTSAPSVQSWTFGGYSDIYTGYPTRGSNVLKVPQGATGYTSSYWNDPLQNASKCGFHIETI